MRSTLLISEYCLDSLFERQQMHDRVPEGQSIDISGKDLFKLQQSVRTDE